MTSTTRSRILIASTVILITAWIGYLFINTSSSTPTELAGSAAQNGSANLSVTIEQADGQADPTTESPIRFTVTFSEPIDASTFTQGDIFLGGTALPSTAALVQVDESTFTLKISGMSKPGTVTALMRKDSVNDLAGNPNTTSASMDGTVAFIYTNDNTSPSVTIEQADGQADPTTESPIRFTVTFSEPIDASTFTQGDIFLGGTALPSTAALVQVDESTFTLEISGMSKPGTVTALIPRDSVNDLAGNPNTTSVSVDGTVAFIYTNDNASPSVTIEQADGQADPTTESPIRFTVTFSEAIDASTFTQGDIFLGGTALPTTAALIQVDESTFTLEVSGMSKPGTVTALIRAGTVNDLAGNPNTTSASVDGTVNYYKK